MNSVRVGEVFQKLLLNCDNELYKSDKSYLYGEIHRACINNAVDYKNFWSNLQDNSGIITIVIPIVLLIIYTIFNYLFPKTEKLSKV